MINLKDIRNWKEHSLDLSTELEKLTHAILIMHYPEIVFLGEDDDITRGIEASSETKRIIETWQIKYKECVLNGKPTGEIIKDGMAFLAKAVAKQIIRLIEEGITEEDAIGNPCVCYSIPLRAYETEKEDALKLTINAEAEVGITWIIPY